MAVANITLNEAAEKLGVQPASLRQQIANGKFRAVKKGRDWFVTPQEIKRYDASRKRAAKP